MAALQRFDNRPGSGGAEVPEGHPASALSAIFSIGHDGVVTPLRLLLGIVLLALWSGCSPDADPFVVDRKVFLTNIDSGRTLVDGEPQDLHDISTRKVGLRSWGIGFDMRRIMVAKPDTELRFVDILGSGTELQASAVYRDDPGSSSSYALEIIAVSPSGERAVVWSDTLTAPPSEEERAWVEIETH